MSIANHDGHVDRQTRLSFVGEQRRPKYRTRTQQTSRDAHRAAVALPRRVLIANHVRACGCRGATRDEIAVALSLPIQSVTGPVRRLLDSRELHENGLTRLTRYGSPAAVLVAQRACK